MSSTAFSREGEQFSMRCHPPTPKATLMMLILWVTMLLEVIVIDIPYGGHIVVWVMSILHVHVLGLHVQYMYAIKHAAELHVIVFHTIAISLCLRMHIPLERSTCSPPEMRGDTMSRNILN